MLAPGRAGDTQVARPPGVEAGISGKHQALCKWVETRSGIVPGGTEALPCEQKICQILIQAEGQKEAFLPHFGLKQGSVWLWTL